MTGSKLKCPFCNEELSADLDVTGGCTFDCGSLNGGYCYCDSLDVSVSFSCNSNNKKCRGYIFAPEGLRDRYGVERWFTKNYVKKDNGLG